MSAGKHVFLLVCKDTTRAIPVVAVSFMELQKKADAVIKTMDPARRAVLRHPSLSEDAAVRKAGNTVLTSLPKLNDRLDGLLATLRDDPSSTMKGPMALQTILDSHPDGPIPLMCFSDGEMNVKATQEQSSRPVEEKQRVEAKSDNVAPSQPHAVTPVRQRVPASPKKERTPTTSTGGRSGRAPSEPSPSSRGEALYKVVDQVRSPPRPVRSNESTKYDTDLGRMRSPSKASAGARQGTFVGRRIIEVSERVRSPSKNAMTYQQQADDRDEDAPYVFSGLRNAKAAATHAPGPVAAQPPSHSEDEEDPEELALRKRYRDLMQGMDRRVQEHHARNAQYESTDNRTVASNPPRIDGHKGVVPQSDMEHVDSLTALRLQLLTTTDTSITRQCSELRLTSPSVGTIDTDEVFDKIKARRLPVEFAWVNSSAPGSSEQPRQPFSAGAEETATVKVFDVAGNNYLHVRIVIAPIPALEELRALIAESVPGFAKYTGTSREDLFFCVSAGRKGHEEVRRRPVKSDHDVAAVCQLCMMPGSFLRVESH